MSLAWPKYSTGPPLRFWWTSNGDNFDLTTWTCTFRFGSAATPTDALWARACVHDGDDPAAGGRGRYEWQAGDLSNQGEYLGQIVATKGAEIRKSPVFAINVTDSLDLPTD